MAQGCRPFPPLGTKNLASDGQSDGSKCRRFILGNCSPEEMSVSGPLQPDSPHGPGGQLYQ